jgi:two-component system NtrC family sensor kinase
MTIRLKLTILSIAGILVANALISLAVFSYLESVWLQEVQQRVQRNLRAAEAMCDARIRNLAGCLQVAALSDELSAAGAAAAGSGGQMPAMLAEVRRAGAMDFVTLLDNRGHIVVRADSEGTQDGDLSENALVCEALRTKKTVTGTERVSGASLARISQRLASRARIDLLPTPEAKPILETSCTDGLISGTAVPLLDERGTVRGVLYGGDLMNQREDLVDSIRDAILNPPVRDVPSQDTVTVFLGDVRIATNVRKTDGHRAVGTRMSQQVAEQVLERGEIWEGPAFVVNDRYVTAYEPIRDPQQQVVGALYVGLLQSPFVHKRNTLGGVLLIMVLSGTLSCFLLIYFMNYLVLRPAEKVIAMSRRFIGGDLTARVHIRPPGEIGLLCQAVDQMAEAVVEREQQLKIATSKQLHHSEKLSSLGRLAAGVAHEINNPLTGVLTFAHLMREKPNMDDQDRQDLDLIIHETSRAAEIVRGLLDFARERAVNKEPMNLNEAVVRTTRLIRNQKLFDRIVIDEDLATDLPDIDGDMNQLQQVLLNLSLNACEAMSSGGTLTIRTQTQEAGVVVKIADTGCGIKPEHLERIFEPFFTTKPVGKGTGLGLSVSYGIVQQHGGNIELDSEVGRGTMFTIVFPLSGHGPVAESPDSVPRQHPFLAPAGERKE